jgi:hypothetical protein
MKEIWHPSETSQSLPNSEVLVDGIGTFHRVSINGNTSFPYLDIQLSWNEEGVFYFVVYRKPGELVKYESKTSSHSRPFLAYLSQ